MKKKIKFDYNKTKDGYVINWADEKIEVSNEYIKEHVYEDLLDFIQQLIEQGQDENLKLSKEEQEALGSELYDLQLIAGICLWV